MLMKTHDNITSNVTHEFISIYSQHNLYTNIGTDIPPDIT